MGQIIWYAVQIVILIVAMVFDYKETCKKEKK